MQARNRTRKSIALIALFISAFALSPVIAGGVPAFPSPSAAAVNEAKSITWTYQYNPSYSAHTNGAYNCGYLITLAMAAHAGDTSVEYRLLRQFRYLLEGTHCMVAAGGYGSQHERIFTGTAVILRETPWVWDQLTATEKNKVDLLMKAAMVASAYTTSDFGASNGQNTDLMGGTNLGRGWNPNFREGMIGMMIVGSAWMGSGQAAEEFLNDYDHADFCSQLSAAGLTNTYNTFNYKVAYPTSNAPTAYLIERDIQSYRYLDYTLDEIMDIYGHLTLGTYDRNVNTGLYGGAGINGAGKMYSGQAGLPNIGTLGMLHEFDGTDGSGLRSSVGYAYDGFRPNMINQIVLLITGNWESGSLADSCIDRMRIGIPDLFYKLEHGYINYSNGHAGGTVWMDDDGRDFYMTESVWFDVVLPFHDGLLSCADAGNDVSTLDTDGDGIHLLTLDGSASFAGQGKTITNYSWVAGTGAIAAGPTAQMAFPVGITEVTLTITDSSGASSSDSITIEIIEPDMIARAGDDITVTADPSTGTAIVHLDSTASTSKNGPIVMSEWKNGQTVLFYLFIADIELPVGTHTLTLTVYDSQYNNASDDIVITVEPASVLPGDADGDGDVDISDFLILKSNYGTEAGATTSTGDFDGDGDVDISDFLILKSNYGT